MKKKQFSILCIGLILTACGQQNKNETTMDFTDDVQTALADGQAFSQMRVCHLRHLCLLARRVILYSHILRYENHRMCMEGSRRPAARREHVND